MNYIKRILILIAIFFIGKFLLDITFKIRYSRNEIFEINNLKISDSLTITHGKILLGKNIKGKLEAIILPDNLKLNDSSTVEYVYLRFFPEWYNNNIKPYIGNKIEKDTWELHFIGEALHNSNFSNYMHINSYPIVRKDYVPYVLKIKESAEKIRLQINIAK